MRRSQRRVPRQRPALNVHSGNIVHGQTTLDGGKIAARKHAFHLPVAAACLATYSRFPNLMHAVEVMLLLLLHVLLSEMTTVLLLLLRAVLWRLVTVQCPRRSL